MNKVMRFLKEEDGVTAIEYGLLATVVALVMAVGAGTLGTSLSTLFSDIGGRLVAPTP